MPSGQKATGQKGRWTRRQFLGVIGAAAGLATVGIGFDKGRGSLQALSSGPESTTGTDEWVYSWCRQCVLPPCGIRVRVKDGIAVEVAGDPNSPTNQGRLCSRGNSVLSSVYNPYRLKKPLRRTNPKKGIDQDPKWVEISWDEALDIISERLRKVRADDPRKFMLNNGFARAGSMLEGWEFCEAFGSPNYVETDGPQCAVHFGSSYLQGNFTGPAYDPLYTRYLILVGEGTLANAGYAVPSKPFVDAVARGMKVVVVNPRYTPEASKGEWVPIRPGTDLAFVLALQHIIVHELGTFDVDFIRNRTNGPYLIGPDGHYVRDRVSGKPLMFDSSDGRAKVFDDPTCLTPSLEGEVIVQGVKCRPGFEIFKQAIAAYTPEWAEEKCTVPAETMRRIAAEFVEAAQIGATITLGGTTMPLRPACIESGRGAIAQQYGANYHIAAIVLNMLVGAMDCPGGGRGTMGPPHKSTPPPLALAPDEDGVVAPKVEAVTPDLEFPPNRLDGKRTYFPYSHDMPHIAYDAVLNPERYKLEYRPEVLMIWGSNQVIHGHRPGPTLEAMAQFDFVFALSYSLDEPAHMADVVLPESAGLERFACGGSSGVVQTSEGLRQFVCRLVAQQVIKPVYDSRQPEEVFTELARRAGFLFGPGGMNDLYNSGKYAPSNVSGPFLLDLNKQYTPKELAERVLKSAVGAQYSLDGLRHRTSAVVQYSPLEALYPIGPWMNRPMRYSLYHESWLGMGEHFLAWLREHGITPPGWTEEELREYYQPVAGWIDPRKHVSGDFPLAAVNWKTAQFSFGGGGSQDNGWLHEVAKRFDPYVHVVCLNTATARKLGFQDGDPVIVESVYGGRAEGRVKTVETIHPDAVGIAGNFGHFSKGMAPDARKGIHFNALLSPGPADIDPITGGYNGTPRVRLLRA